MYPSLFFLRKVVKAWEDNNNEEFSMLYWYNICIPGSGSEKSGKEAVMNYISSPFLSHSFDYKIWPEIFMII